MDEGRGRAGADCPWRWARVWGSTAVPFTAGKDMASIQKGTRDGGGAEHGPQRGLVSFPVPGIVREGASDANTRAVGSPAFEKRDG